MDQLTIVGTEDDKLVLATESGQRFSLAIDDVLRRELKRRARPDAAAAEERRASPRDIQSHVRAGLSAPEVATLLGTTIEDVQRYEAPVLAEREHMVNQALAVPVLIGTEVEPDGSLSFGTAIRAKLADAEATGERWTSWKEDSGWMIKLEFTSDEIEHDARWSFDPRRSTLAPQNSAATQLSRQGSLPEGLIPRLRALDAATPSWKDDSRFDSGAFGPRRLPDPVPDEPAEQEAAPPTRPTAADVAVKRAPEPAAPANGDTADLLEALRRRRGQREPLPGSEESSPFAPSARQQAPSAPTPIFEPANAESGDDAEIVAEKLAASERVEQSHGRRKGRTALPSWDEIVFGAKTEE